MQLGFRKHWMNFLKWLVIFVQWVVLGGLTLAFFRYTEFLQPQLEMVTIVKVINTSAN